MTSRNTIIAAVLLVAAGLPNGAWAHDAGWRSYGEGGYSIDLPLGLFERTESSEGRLMLRQINGPGQIGVYAGRNPKGASLEEFEETLTDTDRVREVTYHAAGNSWFVLSGYYGRTDTQPQDLIFYLKFMFNADHSRFAGFEISYPRSAKHRFDPIVRHMEKSLRPPD